MLTREDFTTPDWEALQRTVIGSAIYISRAEDEGPFDTLREMTSIKKVIKLQENHTNSRLVGDILEHPAKNDHAKLLDSSNEAIEVGLFQDIERTIKFIYERDKTELKNYRDLILNIISVIADKVDGVSDNESEAFMKLYTQLMKDPAPPKPEDPYASVR